MHLLVVALLAVFIALAIRLLLSYKHFRWLELAIPGPPSLPVLGNALSSVGVTPDTAMARLLVVWDNHHSELWRLSAFGHLVVLVSDPDHLRELFTRRDLVDKDALIYGLMHPIDKGLLTLNGDTWRAHRRALEPAFHQSLLDRYTSVFSAEALGCVHRVRSGEAQDVADNLQSMVAQALFCTAVASDKDEEEMKGVLPLVTALINTFSKSVGYRLVQPWLWSNRVFALTRSGRTIRRQKRDAAAYIKGIMADRRAELKQHGPKSCDDDLQSRRRRTLLDLLLEPDDRLSLADDEIVDEILIFLGAAIDTTTSTLAWTLKVLSLRQDVQDRLLQEVDEVLGKVQPSCISTEDLAKLEYTERVLKETLRLLPAGPIFGRGVRQQTEFCGHTLPAGTTLIINVLGAHRHPGHWPDPLRFDPDRFLPERNKDRHPYAYVPFSRGPRNCIGSRYAMMLMKTYLATLVPRYRIDPVDDGFTEPAEFPMAVGTTSRMVGGTSVVFTPRVDCTA